MVHCAVLCPVYRQCECRQVEQRQFRQIPLHIHASFLMNALPSQTIIFFSSPPAPNIFTLLQYLFFDLSFHRFFFKNFWRLIRTHRARRRKQRGQPMKKNRGLKKRGLFFFSIHKFINSAIFLIFTARRLSGEPGAAERYSRAASSSVRSAMANGEKKKQ